jgi:hypothetical protein
MELGLSDPSLQVVSHDFDPTAGRIDINIDFRSGSRFMCP